MQVKTFLEEMRNQRPGAMAGGAREGGQRAGADDDVGAAPAAANEKDERPRSRRTCGNRAPPLPSSPSKKIFVFSISSRQSGAFGGFASAMWSSASCSVATGFGQSVMRSVPEAVFGNAMTSRMRRRARQDHERCRSRPSAMPPCGGAPKRSASSRKPNFARASSSPMPEHARRSATARPAGGSGSSRRRAPCRSARRRRRAPSRAAGRSRGTRGPPRAAR